jgi:uncharacterized protein (DUF1800 family)
MRRRRVTPQYNSRVAFMRFGLGPKPGGPARIGMQANSALEACLKELRDPAAALLNDPSLPTAEQCGQLGLRQNMPGDRPVDALWTQERVARFTKSTEPEVGFVERLVMFWTNHFSLFPNSDLVRGTMGLMERAVIRPNVLGKFSDMLKGVITHPAMIRRLDNHNSIGPNSVDGLRTRRGLNENLGRETLELYTVGVNSGYTQTDVTNLALILTGWTFERRIDQPNAGLFIFNPNAHEPGTFTLMRSSFGQPGQAKGLAALDMLAVHPKTAEHLAFKLIMHFITDTPPAASVRSLARVFQRTGGDLRAVSEALLRLPIAWSEPMNRIRQPHEWLVSMARAVGFDNSKGALLQQRFNSWLAALNQPHWQWPTPDGSPDLNSFWLSPNAVRLRRDAAFAFCQRFLMSDEPRNQAAYWRTNRPQLANPALVAQDLLPGVLPPATITQLATMDAKNDTEVLSNLALLFMTPEFLNR